MSDNNTYLPKLNCFVSNKRKAPAAAPPVLQCICSGGINSGKTPHENVLCQATLVLTLESVGEMLCFRGWVQIRIILQADGPELPYEVDFCKTSF